MNNMYRMYGTGEVVTESRYRAMHENMHFPDPFTPDDADQVLVLPRPVITENQQVLDDGVELVNGQWQTKWLVQEFTAEFIAERLLNAQNAKVLEIKGWMDAANSSTFNHLDPNTMDTRTFDYSEGAAKQITAMNGYLNTHGTFPVTFPGAWLDKEGNAMMMSTVEEFNGLYASMVNTGISNFMYSQYLQGMAMNADTLAEVAAVVW